jgi:outer membrane protein assembly factor BamB
MTRRIAPGRLGIVHAVAVLACLSAGAVSVHGEDWPQFRGKGNTGVWEETGILEKFPAEGLARRVRWRTPVKVGYGGPSVADGRVFVTDFAYTTRPRGTERALALDEATGRILWTREWESNYSGMGYDRGPRASPTVDGDRVYFLGAMGALLCLNAQTGDIVWKKDLPTEYSMRTETWDGNWGFVAPPLVDGDQLIVKVGGEPNAKVVAFDKRTGKERWRALKSDTGPAPSPLVIVTAAGRRQLIVWHDAAITALDPQTGEVYWEHPWKIDVSMAVHTPVQVGSLLFFSAYYQGALTLSLDDQKPTARVLWKSKSDSEVITDAVHVMIMTPIILGDYIYGLDTFGQLRCVNLKTGERVWETQAVTKERARWASGHIVLHGDRLFVNNDRGELIIVEPKPDGYHEISRTFLIKPTSPPENRRELVNVNWSHPAYASKHIYARNDEEIICASLAVDGK